MEPPNTPAATATAPKTMFSASTFVTKAANEKINAIAARDDRKRAYVLRVLLDFALEKMPAPRRKSARA